MPQCHNSQVHISSNTNNSMQLMQFNKNIYITLCNSHIISDLPTHIPKCPHFSLFPVGSSSPVFQPSVHFLTPQDASLSFVNFILLSNYFPKTHLFWVFSWHCFAQEIGPGLSTSLSFSITQLLLASFPNGPSSICALEKILQQFVPQMWPKFPQQFVPQIIHYKSPKIFSTMYCQSILTE